jgi:hypothetical protein
MQSCGEGKIFDPPDHSFSSIHGGVRIVTMFFILAAVSKITTICNEQSPFDYKLCQVALSDADMRKT